jgi:hypothetical protein
VPWSCFWFLKHHHIVEEARKIVSLFRKQNSLSNIALSDAKIRQHAWQTRKKWRHLVWVIINLHDSSQATVSFQWWSHSNSSTKDDAVAQPSPKIWPHVPTWFSAISWPCDPIIVGLLYIRLHLPCSSGDLNPHHHMQGSH